MAALDPITLTILWNSLIAISEEMGSILRRTAFSDVVREARDYATSVFDAKGRMVAQGAFTPGHMGASFSAVANTLRTFPPEQLAPGDMILLNDLSMSTGHLPDIFSIAPVFYRGELVAFTVNSAHHADVGGAAPGSLVVSGVTDVYQEGIRILPVKYWEKGKPSESVHTLISANSRVPHKVLGDLKAQANANRAGERRLIALIESYGLETVQDATEEIINRSEAATRAAIRKVPNGNYHFEDYLDDYGPDTEPLKVCVHVEVHDEEIVVDFAGTDPQVPAGINSYYNFTFAYAFFALKCLTDPTIPQNEGCRRPITVRAPEGSFLNARHPAPGGGRALVLNRIVEAIMGALAPALPQRAITASSDFAMSSFGGEDPNTGKAFVFYELLFGGFGARPTKDGAEALCSSLDMRNVPIEVHEIHNPILVERFALRNGTAGAGKYRGGCGIQKDIRMLTPGIRFSNLTERHKFAPYGLFGGCPGAVGETVLNPGQAGERQLHSKGNYKLQTDDVVSIRLAGAGGWGIPLERDPQAVLRDVRDEYITAAEAESLYGVVLDQEHRQVLEPQTADLRRQLRGRIGEES